MMTRDILNATSRRYPYTPNVVVELVAQAQQADDALRNRMDDAQRADSLEALTHVYKLVRRLTREIHADVEAAR